MLEVAFRAAFVAAVVYSFILWGKAYECKVYQVEENRRLKARIEELKAEERKIYIAVDALVERVNVQEKKSDELEGTTDRHGRYIDEFQRWRGKVEGEEAKKTGGIEP